MINKNITVTVLLLAALAFAGYSIMKRQGPAPGAEPQAREQAVDETIEFVSTLDKIHPDEIKVINFEETEWPDSCLGLARGDEVCAQVLVPGYRVTLEADGQTMIFRTNENGSSIRRDLEAEK